MAHVHLLASKEQDEKEFPWHLGVYDSHCHPTDTASSIDKIPDMKTRALTVMATRAQDQGLVAEFAEKLGSKSKPNGEVGKEGSIVPAFGWHPWFSHQIYDDSCNDSWPIKQYKSKKAHYEEILSPPSYNEEFLQSLPDPRPLSVLLKELRNRLEQFPLALVGEVGLDRSFRIPGANVLHEESGSQRDLPLTPGGRQGRPLSPHRVTITHQRKVLASQLNLAGEMRRAVSIHGVAAHGAVYDALRETWRGHELQTLSNRAQKRQRIRDVEVGNEESQEDKNLGQIRSPLFPPRVCLHSYSGPPETLKQYLHPSVPVRVFFSFSSLVNFSSSTKHIFDVIKIIPEDKILVESDLHTAGKEMDDLMEDVIRKVCKIKNWSLVDGINQLASNWKTFVYGE